MKKILITGINGFIGHHMCEAIIKNTDWHIYGMDKLSYASFGFDRLKNINVFDSKRIQLFTFDFNKPIEDYLCHEMNDVNYIVHMGAETHVDRSIENPKPFVMSNVLGTMNILNFARWCKNLEKMIYFSTDEIFGPASCDEVPLGFKEWDRYNSTNPYSASKAAGEELCLAWANTYKLPVTITHTMNVGGERQHPEKYIPSTIRKVYLGEKVLIHSNPERTKAGSRFYIHARNVASAVMFLLDKGNIRDKYNIVGESETDNLKLAQMIASYVGKPLKYELINFHESRPGHDLRYALCGEKLESMGWIIPKKIEVWLEKVVKWSLEKKNKRWINL